MKFLANENFPVKSYRILEASGYDILHVGFEFPSVEDEEVLRRAISDNRIVITFDADYGNLVFVKGYKPRGIIYLRFKDFPSDFPAIFLSNLFQAGSCQFDGYFTVIDKNRIRQRKI